MHSILVQSCLTSMQWNALKVILIWVYTSDGNCSKFVFVFLLGIFTAGIEAAFFLFFPFWKPHFGRWCDAAESVTRLCRGCVSDECEMDKSILRKTGGIKEALERNWQHISHPQNHCYYFSEDRIKGCQHWWKQDGTVQGCIPVEESEMELKLLLQNHQSHISILNKQHIC